MNLKNVEIIKIIKIPNKKFRELKILYIIKNGKNRNKRG